MAKCTPGAIDQVEKEDLDTQRFVNLERNMTHDAKTIAKKVEEILAQSSREPGLNELNSLSKLMELSREVQAALDYSSEPTLATQTTHLGS